MTGGVSYSSKCTWRVCSTCRYEWAMKFPYREATSHWLVKFFRLQGSEVRRKKYRLGRELCSLSLWDSKVVSRRQFYGRLLSVNKSGTNMTRISLFVFLFFLSCHSFSKSPSSVTPVFATAFSFNSYILFFSWISFLFHLLFSNILLLVLFAVLLLFILLHRLLICLQTFLIFFLFFIALLLVLQGTNFLKELHFRIVFWKCPVPILSRIINNLVKNFRFYTHFIQ